MRRDDAVEDIQGITAVSVSVGIDGQAAYTTFLVGFIQCGVLRSDCILSELSESELSSGINTLH